MFVIAYGNCANDYLNCVNLTWFDYTLESILPGKLAQLIQPEQPDHPQFGECQSDDTVLSHHPPP